MIYEALCYGDTANVATTLNKLNSSAILRWVQS